jgi:putative membrane-bound dehydrogenase-like protein
MPVLPGWAQQNLSRGGHRQLRAGICLLLIIFAGWAGQNGTQAAQPTRAKSPLSVADSLAAFQLEPGLKIDIVAAEPEVVSPVSIAFDEQGQLWVVEMSDYPNGPKPGEPPQSRIKLLEDRDGDGRFETAHIFADKLLFATGVQPWRGGVIVTLAGEIAYFKDTDGDHRADVRETWYRGFAQDNPQLRANHPRFALDNHIYVANGLKGGTIVADRAKWAPLLPQSWIKETSISGKDFRFDPLTGMCEAVSGNGQFGLTFDDFGNRFICSNRNPCRHVVLEDRYLKRNPYLAVRDVAQDVSPAAEKSRIYPISRAWTTSNLHAGQFTAACGLLIYRGDALPHADYYGNSFVCEPTGNLVHRDILEPDGPTFKSHYAREGVEFLASPDEWFRPVDLANGPDGALYVVDMYRAVIEHPDWVPAELKNRPDLYDGSDRGRIYRIVGKDAKIDPVRRGNLNLVKLTGPELARTLEHPNAWHRETAARLIVQRQDKSAVDNLEGVVRDRNATSTSRVAALSALDGLNGVSDALLESLIVDDEVHLRDRAILIAEQRLGGRPRLLNPVSPDPQSRKSSPPGIRDKLCSGRCGNSFQVALAIGNLGSLWVDRLKLSISDEGVGAADVLARIIMADIGNEWIRRGVYTSVLSSQQAAILVVSVTEIADRKIPADLDSYRSVLRELFEMIGAGESGPGVLHGLRELVSPKNVGPDAAAGLRLAATRGLGLGMGRGDSSLFRNRAQLPDLERAAKTAEEAEAYAETRKYLNVVFADAIRLAGDPGAPAELRLEAIGCLQVGSFDESSAILQKLMQSDPSQEMRLLALDALASFGTKSTVGNVEPRIGAMLLERFSSQTPPFRRRVLQAMLKNRTRIDQLLTEIDAQRIAVSELDPATVQVLTNHKDDAIRERSRKLLAAAIPADRKEVLEKYQPALSLAADAKAGRAVFEKNCATCHKIGDLGVNVAPEISDSRTKTPAQLLTDILNPNQAIDNNYVSYAVVTKDGKTELGIIATETATSITLKQPEGKTVLILRQEIDELRSSGLSLMPEGLEKNISVQQMADLIAFIKNWRYLDGAVPLGK